MTSPPRSVRALWLAEDILSWLHVLVRTAGDGVSPSLLMVRDDVLGLLDELGGFEAIADAFRPSDEVDAPS